MSSRGGTRFKPKLYKSKEPVSLDSSSEVAKGKLRPSSEYGELVTPSSRVIGKTGKVVVNERIKQSINDLVPHAHEYIEELNPQVGDKFRKLSEDLTYIYSNDPELYFYIVNDIVLKAFKDVKHPASRTVGGYFVGCSRKHNDSDNLACSASCIVALPHQESEPCGDLVLVYTKTRLFFALNEVGNADRALVHIECPNFEGFYRSNIDSLRKKGIKQIAFLDWGKHKDFMNIDDLPTVTESSDASSAGWVLFAIALFLLALGGLGYLAVKGNVINIMEN